MINRCAFLKLKCEYVIGSIQKWQRIRKTCISVYQNNSKAENLFKSSMKILLIIWLKVNSTNPTLCSLCKVEIQSHYSFNVYWDARIFQISILSTFVFQKYEICKDVYTYSSFCVLVCWNFIGLLWYLNPDSNSKMNFFKNLNSILNSWSRLIEQAHQQL